MILYVPFFMTSEAIYRFILFVGCFSRGFGNFFDKHIMRIIILTSYIKNNIM